MNILGEGLLMSDSPGFLPPHDDCTAPPLPDDPAPYSLAQHPAMFVRLRLPAVARDILKRSDPLDLDMTCRLKSGTVADGPDCGHMELPADFLRLASFRMPDWYRTLHAAATCVSLVACMDTLRHRRMRTPSHPFIIIEGDSAGRVLRYFGTAMPGERPAVATYIPEPRWRPDDTILLPGSVYDDILATLAAGLEELL